MSSRLPRRAPIRDTARAGGAAMVECCTRLNNRPRPAITPADRPAAALHAIATVIDRNVRSGLEPFERI